MEPAWFSSRTESGAVRHVGLNSLFLMKMHCSLRQSSVWRASFPARMERYVLHQPVVRAPLLK
jgi:hypothetical protein